MKKCMSVCLVCVFVLCMSVGFAAAAGKIPVIVASPVDMATKSYVVITWNRLAELANKYSDNSFEFKVFPSMQLGDEQETVRGLQQGTIQISTLATNNFGVFAPSCGWVNMPYLFDSLDQFRQIVDAMWDQHNEWAIKEAGARCLSIVDIGFRQLTSNAKFPVRSLADAKGMKIRTPQNPLIVSTFKALGLNPTAVSFAETFNALQQGVVDGQECAYNLTTTLKFYEAQKYGTDINYAVHSANIIVNEKWLQSLTEKQRDALIRAGREAMEYERTQVAGLMEEDVVVMKKHGMELLGKPTDYDEWVRLGRTAWPKCYEVIGNGDAAKGKAIVDLALSKKK